jgi:hypothetical protein
MDRSDVKLLAFAPQARHPASSHRHDFRVEIAVDGMECNGLALDTDGPG